MLSRLTDPSTLFFPPKNSSVLVQSREIVLCQTGSNRDHHGSQDVRRVRDRAAGPGRVGAGAGVRPGGCDVVRGVAGDKLHAVPGLHHRQH